MDNFTEVEVLNGTLRVGDRVAVAPTGRHTGLRIGTVLEILPAIWGFNQRNGGTRVRVLVDKSSGLTGSHFNPATGKWEFFPFTKVYDDPRSMVKLGALEDAL